MRRRSTTPFALAAIALAAAACAASAAAHHDSDPGEQRVSESVGEVGTSVVRHGDPVGRFKAGADERASVSSAAPSFQAALPAACPITDKTVDDTNNSPYGNPTPAIKVIYAHPVDVGNRLGTYGPVIQAGVKAISDFAAGESGGALSLRFDIGTYEGPHCVDIQRVTLPQTSAYYAGIPDLAFSRVGNDVYARLGPQPGKRNFLIYADGVGPAGIGGEAEGLIGPGFDHPAGTLQNQGGLFAIAFGRGGSDFFGSGAAFPPGQTSRTHLEIALHEASHNLGAVQQSAPNSSGTNGIGSPAGHCNDQYDLMCYEDGGSGVLFVDSNCDGDASLPADPYGPDFQAWDCNKDDYFAVNPPGGSYLDTHWNLANSVFLCAFAACAPPDQQAPNTRITKQPRKKTTKRKIKIKFTVTERSQTTCQVDRRRPRACQSPFKFKVKRGRHKIKVGATDAVGLVDQTPATAKFRVVKKRKRR